MGIMDTAKMVNQARKAKKKMEQVEAVGKSGSAAVLINGLYEISDIEFDIEELVNSLGASLSQDEVEKIVNQVKKDMQKAMKNAKKQLEKELASMTSLDDLKGLLGG